MHKKVRRLDASVHFNFYTHRLDATHKELYSVDMSHSLRHTFNPHRSTDMTKIASLILALNLVCASRSFSGEALLTQTRSTLSSHYYKCNNKFYQRSDLQDCEAPLIRADQARQDSSEAYTRRQAELQKQHDELLAKHKPSADELDQPNERTRSSNTPGRVISANK
jgi:hypothetical protein